MTKLVLLTGLLIACGGPATPPPAPPSASRTAATAARPPAAGEPKPSARASLYDRLGGKPAIAAVTGELLDRVAADARIKYRSSIPISASSRHR